MARRLWVDGEAKGGCKEANRGRGFWEAEGWTLQLFFVGSRVSSARRDRLGE